MGKSPAAGHAFVSTVDAGGGLSGQRQGHMAWRLTRMTSAWEGLMAGMQDWAGYRAQLGATLGGLAKVNPDILRANEVLSNAAPTPGTLDAKTRELIALAVAVTTRCDGCIAFHSDLARKAGATREELAETLGVAIALNAGAALIYSARAMDAFDSK